MTPRQKKFIEVYAGNATEAARLAGYQGSEAVLGKTGFDLLRNPKIAAAIREREKRESRPLIATRQERQKFWSDTLRDEDVDLRDRLRASELLGKSEADFTEKLEHSGKLTLEELVAASMKPEVPAAPEQPAIPYTEPDETAESEGAE